MNGSTLSTAILLASAAAVCVAMVTPVQGKGLLHCFGYHDYELVVDP